MNPQYDRYFRDLRWMLQHHSNEVSPKSIEGSTLMSAILDSDVTEESFIGTLEKERSGKTTAWNTFRRYISRMKPGKKNE